MTELEVFLTGASGFVGQHLVRTLVHKGHSVKALCRRATKLPEGCQEIRGDLLDENTYAAHLQGVDSVIHLAAMLHPVEDEKLAWRTNHEATIQLYEKAQSTGIGHFVFVSSIAAIGTPMEEGRITTSTECRPLSPYGASKRAAETDLMDRADHPTRISIVRPPTVYGRGEQRNFLALTRAVATGYFPIPGSGSNRMSFCHVSNVVDALVFLLEHPSASGLFHITDPDPTTLSTAVHTIASALGTQPLGLPFPMVVAKLTALLCELGSAPFGLTPVLSRQRLQTLTQDVFLDCSDFERLGFEARISFTEGVGDTINWYREASLIQ